MVEKRTKTDQAERQQIKHYASRLRICQYIYRDPLLGGADFMDIF